MSLLVVPSIERACLREDIFRPSAEIRTTQYTIAAGLARHFALMVIQLVMKEK